MPISTKQTNADSLATWTRERSNEEIHNLLGRRMAAIALDSADDEDDSEASLYDLMTV